ncbi:MAG: histidine--tRNA ligase [Candidatus Babeliales bacterium]|nr:histidine--tRNA ligase [Candidatus Babeliales bacterium]
MFSKIKGTQDFLDLRLYNFIVDSLKKHLASYHFSEIATPILEPTDLFKRSLGLQTDVVTKEMFTINTGPEGEGICLRPEATASVVRAFVENSIQDIPWKVFLVGPMFRHERPQKGRYRQFHQVSMEIIGSASVAQDVQFIKMLDRYFHEKLGMNAYALQLNFLGCPEDRAAFKLILHDFLQTDAAKNICNFCTARKEHNILRIFDCKNPICQEIYQKSPRLIDYLCKPCTVEWQQVKDQLHLLSVSFVYQPNLVRGLDYYNKTVFEFTSNNLGAQNAFCGGGRYDSLVAQVGGKHDQPSIGAAIGIERVMLLLESAKDQALLPQAPALHVIIPMDAAQQMLALLLADELQAIGLCIEVLLDGGSMKSMMRHANKLAAAYCLILGQDEQDTRTVTVKNMVTSASDRIPQVELVNYLSK